MAAAVPSTGRASLVEASPRSSQAAASAEGLYERHSAKILGYCLHQLGSREEAEDAVQTTFMNAFRALERGVVPESESAWLFKIAENVCLSRRRSSWRRGRVESPSDFDVIEEIVPGPTRQRDELIGIEDALASMPDQQRRAILLREWQGLSYREIAAELEVSQSAVETLIFRARRSLANGLEQPERAQRPKRKSFRRALNVAEAGTALTAAKTLLAGSAAVQATAAAVAVTAVAGSAAALKNEGHSPRPAEDPPGLVVEAASKPAAAAPAAAERAEAAPEAAPTAVGRWITLPPKTAQPEVVPAAEPAALPPAPAAAPPHASATDRPAPHAPPVPVAQPEPAQPPVSVEPPAAPSPQPSHPRPSKLVVVVPRPAPDAPAVRPVELELPAAAKAPQRGPSPEPEAAQQGGPPDPGGGRRP